MFAKKKPEPILCYSIEHDGLILTTQTRRPSSGLCFLKRSRHLTYCISCLRLFLRCFLPHCILSLNFIQQYFLCRACVVICEERVFVSEESLNVSISGESSRRIHSTSHGTVLHRKEIIVSLFCAYNQFFV